MFQRKLALLIGFILVTCAPLASALGLGELTLQSTLNEPFRAELYLNDVGSLNKGELVVSFATQQEFDRNHLERHFFYNEFEFEVVWSDTEPPKVLISSHSVVREPFLAFIVQARWPSGRVQREYTILMDKPAVIK